MPDTAWAGPERRFVPESRFGIWFLGTRTWSDQVLRPSLYALERLIPARLPSYPVILDAGCGGGHGFAPLHRRFKPERLIGIEYDPGLAGIAAEAASRLPFPVEARRGDLAALDLPDQSVDLIFCHQVFHHLCGQEAALGHFHRVLKPGGLLLFAESTKAYIHSWIIRLLFRHDMEVQRTAPEYLALIRAAGFSVAPEAISYPYLWWSRSDLGLMERLLGIGPPALREETLIYLVASRARTSQS